VLFPCRTRGPRACGLHPEGSALPSRSVTIQYSSVSEILGKELYVRCWQSQGISQKILVLNAMLELLFWCGRCCYVCRTTRRGHSTRRSSCSRTSFVPFLSPPGREAGQVLSCCAHAERHMPGVGSIMLTLVKAKLQMRRSCCKRPICEIVFGPVLYCIAKRNCRVASFSP